MKRVRCVRQCVAVGAAGLCCAMGARVGLAQTLGFSTVWLTNASAPGLPAGVKQSTFERAPVINSSGLVAFEGSLTGTGITSTNDRALFMGLPGALAPTLRAGTAVPGGTSGSFISSPIYTVNLGDSGEAAVQERVVNSAGTTNLGSALVGTGAGSPVLFQQIGTGIPSNIKTMYEPVISGSGLVGYVTDFQTGGPMRAIWQVSDGTAPTRVISQGDAAPGFAAGATLVTIASLPTLDGKGDFGFVGVVQAGANFVPAIYAGPVGGLHPIATTATAVPGVAGSTLRDLTASPAMNRDGGLAFPASFMQGGTVYMGVFAGSVTQPASLRSVYLGSQTLPGTPAGSTTTNITEASISSSGSVAFRAMLNDGGTVNTSNDQGLWISRGTTILNIARMGQAALGATGTIAGFGNVLGAESQLNALDQMAFIASTSTNVVVLYAWDPAVGLIPVVRTGGVFTISPGVTRSISSIYFQGAQINPYGVESILPGGTGGTASGLNDAGELVFGLRFSDGTSGVFETVVPAPGAAALLGIGGLMGGRRRRRPQH